MRKILLTTILTCGSLWSLAQTQGFFLDGVSRTATIPGFTEAEKPASAPTVTVTINPGQEIFPISRYVFGNNANVYMTQMVDQPELLEHIRKLSPNVIRFPGGNLSSVFFWNAEKDQPPPDAPGQLVNSEGQAIAPGYWYGKNNEGWTLSVDNYYEMLAQTNSTGIITTNYGYARYSTAEDPVASAAHLAADWVRYDNGRTKFWEIGNESNGTWQAGHRIKLADNKDGQPEVITGGLYGKHFLVFADSMRKAAQEVGAEIFIGAQLLQEVPADWWNNTDRNWNDGVFQEAGDSPDYYIIHSYYTPYAQNTNAADILNSATRVTTDMMGYVTDSQQDAGVTVKPVALTEWNIFAEGSKQSASYINGMHAALVLGSLMENGYGLAARWDLANGWNNGNDHGIFNQGDEPGGIPKWNPRAPYYYMYYFQQYTGDVLVSSDVSGNDEIEVFATTFTSGEAGIVLVNKSTSEVTAKVNLQDFGYGDRYYTHTLTGGTDNGQFSLKVFVNGEAPTYTSGGPLAFEEIPAKGFLISDGVLVSLPGRSVQYLLVEKGDNAIVGVEKGIHNDIHVYPTRARQSITVTFPRARFSQIELVNAQGKVVEAERVHVSEDRKTLKAPSHGGLYLIRLSGSPGAVIRKIVID